MDKQAEKRKLAEENQKIQDQEVQERLEEFDQAKKGKEFNLPQMLKKKKRLLIAIFFYSW